MAPDVLGQHARIGVVGRADTEADIDLQGLAFVELLHALRRCGMDRSRGDHRGEHAAEHIVAPMVVIDILQRLLRR